MIDTKTHILVTKYLSGEATSEETNSLNEWRMQAPANETLYQEYREAWSIVTSDNVPTPNKDAVWHKILYSIKPIKVYSRQFLIRVASIAATVALITGLSFSFIVSSDESYPTSEIVVKTPKGQKSEVILPDGTSVWLNSGSSIVYDNKYNIDNRQVRLYGEAFFDVTKNDALPFTASTSDVQVQVHGTAFNLKAYEEDGFIDVSLLRGHVTVLSSNNRLLADLSPNQKVTISRNTLLAQVINYDTEVDALWRYGKLRIADESIESVIKKMSRWYGVNITIKDEAKKEHYWFTVKTESLTEMLNLIHKITPINYTISGEEVTIQYK